MESFSVGGGGAGAGAGGDGSEAEWLECLDPESGECYYFNLCSGASQWEPPTWVDDVDPASGATYYFNTATGESVWEKPSDFVPIIRHGAEPGASADAGEQSPLSEMYSRSEKKLMSSLGRSGLAGGAKKKVSFMPTAMAH